MSLKVVNILLMGETGVGKSTFINAFANYMTYDKLDEARDEPMCLIPVCFSIADPDTYESKHIRFGSENSNENTSDTTKSGTKKPICYKFCTDEVEINIIDTPGFADSDGVDSDKNNMDTLMAFIAPYREINAICVLLKPNNARVDVIFKYCLFGLLSHLNKSAADNILFLFTNARSTQYAPGESGPALKSLLEKIKANPPNVNIAYNKDTIYCFDNESFRYLAATGPPNNMEFNQKYKNDYATSWDTYA